MRHRSQGRLGRQSLFLIGMLVVVACSRIGKFGKSSSSSSSPDDTHANVTGMIIDESGSADQMVGWVVVFVERNTGVCRVGVVDPNGFYSLSGLALNRLQTIILLGPRFHLEAVLSMPSATPAALHQFFTLGSTFVPTLIHSGTIMNFVDTTGITIDTKNLTADANANGIPDGMDGTLLLTDGRSKLALAAANIPTTSTLDTDKDGYPNDNDPDINGDGVVNWFDPDMDGDGIINLFSPDANGDGIADAIVRNYYGSQYFTEGMDHAAVQVIQQTGANNTLATKLVFFAAVKAGVSHTGVKVRAPTSLTTGAMAVTTDATTGASVSSPWNNSLAGVSASAGSTASGDVFYKQTVALAAGLAPSPNQCIFIQLLSTVNAATVYTEYPHCFAPMVPGALTATATLDSVTDTFTITMAGTPFTDYESDAAITSFTWSFYLLDPATNKISFSSDAIDGGTTTYHVAASQLALASGTTYNAYITAMSLEKVAGIPLWVINSPTFTISGAP